MSEQEQTQDQPPVERFMLPVPRDFDIRNLPRNTDPPPVVNQAQTEPNYRIESYSIPCENRESANRLLNEHLGPEGRRELNRALQACRAGERVDFDIYQDNSVELGPKGIGQLRLRITLPNPR